MDEESHSTSQNSFNSREALRITNTVFQIVNIREVHCALCETIYSPSNEANRPTNLCRDCEIWLGLYSEERWPQRQRVEEGLQGLVETRRNLVETQRGLEEFRQRFEPHQQRIEPHQQRVEQDLNESWWGLEEFRQRIEPHQQRSEPHQQHVEQDPNESWWDLEEFRQRIEPHQQRSEPHQQHVEQDLNESWWGLEEFRQHFEPQQQRFEPHRQLAERHLKYLPCLVITEEHEKKHNGLECAICLDPLSIGSFVNQLPCLHFFHPLCIVPWLNVRMSCPTCRYKLSSAFHNETMQNSNRRIGFQEILLEGFNVNSSSTSSNINELEVVVSESHNGTTDSSIRDREGSRGGWFLFAAAPIVSLVGIALVECLQNLLGDGRGRGSTGHLPRQCQQQVRMFSSGSSSTRTSNPRENT